MADIRMNVQPVDLSEALGIKGSYIGTDWSVYVFNIRVGQITWKPVDDGRDGVYVFRLKDGSVEHEAPTLYAMVTDLHPSLVGLVGGLLSRLG